MSNKCFNDKGVRVVVNENGNAKVFVKGEQVGGIPQLVNKVGTFFSSGITKGNLWTGKDALAVGQVLAGQVKNENGIKHISQSRFNQLAREYKVFSVIPTSMRKKIFNAYYIG